MLTQRIIPCLDVKAGRVVKGVQFQGLRDVGDPIELACRYEAEGADELVFLDITASSDNRPTLMAYVEAVARKLSIPFTVGGGVRTLADAEALLNAGADKVSVNSAAVSNPALLTDIATAFGAQCCVLAIDAKKDPQSPAHDPVWHVLTQGGRHNTQQNALQWAQQAVDLGAGELLLTSWDADGTRAGFDLPLTKTFAQALAIPVIASGGAHNAQSFVDVFTLAHADAAPAASIFHDGDCTVAQLKALLACQGLTMRL